MCGVCGGNSYKRDCFLLLAENRIWPVKKKKNIVPTRVQYIYILYIMYRCIQARDICTCMDDVNVRPAGVKNRIFTPSERDFGATRLEGTERRVNINCTGHGQPARKNSS